MSEGGGPPEPAGSVVGSSAASRGPAAAYRSFLFADLRGYTSYLERAGNAAGVELLNDYLQIVRTAVAAHDGAEIKVEGDGFHAVFPSASSAVMCGLQIVDRAAAANEERPERPIQVGIGVHAGEALETADGYIGSAVNVAARVCAAAAAGEVLVTGTVRGVTQASIPVTFVSSGKRRLKGIEEPVELFTVLPQGSVSRVARPRSSVRWLAVAAVAAIALAAVAGALALPQSNPVPPTAPPSPTPGALEIGPLRIGSHVADPFRPSFGFRIEDPGWSVYRVYPDALGLLYDGPPIGRLDIGQIPLLYADPCASGGSEVATGTSIDDLVAALQTLPYLQVGEVTAAEIDGNYAVTTDITVSQGAQAACGGFGGDGIAVFRVAEDTWNAVPEETFRLRAVDIEATTIAFIMSIDESTSSSVSALDEFFTRAERIVQSVEF